MSKNLLSVRNVALLSAAACIIAGFIVLGATGGFVIAGMILLFVLPQYSVLRALPIDEDEKWFFSLFIGIGFFSTAVWVVGRFMPFKAAAVATLAVFVILSFFLFKKKPQQK
ncbi:hypothetical protein JXB11_00715 [Candidatus Woesearchaeota archaeon]|nr:hypothetical protein [Candidatus Woesearchaeota archaeon]